MVAVTVGSTVAVAVPDRLSERPRVRMGPPSLPPAVVVALRKTAPPLSSGASHGSAALPLPVMARPLAACPERTAAREGRA